MGVLFMMPTWGAASELWMVRMLEALGRDVVAIASYQRPGAPWGERAEYIRLDDTSGEAHAAGERGLAEAMRWPNISAVLVHYIPLALRYEGAWASTDKPVFVHCHGYDVTWDLRKMESRDRRHFSADYPEAVRRLSKRGRLIANSQTTARKLAEIGVGADRVVVKYLGVPVPSEMPQRGGGGPVAILYLGRLVDFKGPELVIEAFELACEKGLDGRLIMAGDGPLRRECERRRSASAFAGRIELLGEVDAATGQRLREEADIFTAHSRLGPVTRQEEAYGVSFVEAMAAGLPIVSGDGGSLPELIGDSEAGILVRSGEVRGHAEAFLRLGAEGELRRRMGEVGWKRARELFSAERERRELRAILGLAP